jgi:adenosine deaminase
MSEQPAILLVSLGTSPAIVPEAFLLSDVQFTAVHVLTTEKPEVSLITAFFAQHAPRCALSVTRVAEFNDLNTEADHFRFEEVLYRWVIQSAPDPANRWFCLSGGFKTMSAAMQKAAAVLGAAEVFHVLADSFCPGPDDKMHAPITIAEILLARDQHHLHWIRLGRESGWPQLRSVAAVEYPLVTVSEQEGVRRVRAPNQAFSQRLREWVERSHRISGAWDWLPELPFTELAAWSKADLDWLRSPLDPDAAVDRDWVSRLPKVELHCHLGGFATANHDLEMVRQAAAHPEPLPPQQSLPVPADWPLPARPVGLERYRRLGDNNGSKLLRDPGCLRRQCELLYAHLLEQRIVYAEIRCSPANYATSMRSAWIVLNDIREVFQTAMRQAAGHSRSNLSTAIPPPCHVNLLIIGTRKEEGDYRAAIARHLSLAVTAAEHWRDPNECRVVGVDLAGFEDVTTRPHFFREEFTAVHRCGLALTVHAGENDEAEAIWRAVFDLNARRLGHALSLLQSPDLLRSVADRGIGIEMCPFANLQIVGFRLPNENRNVDPNDRVYPLQDYLCEGLRVTVNTDNPGISAANLTHNLLLAARLCPGLTRLDLLWLQRHALDTAFVTSNHRRRLTAIFSRCLPSP